MIRRLFNRQLFGKEVIVQETLLGNRRKGRPRI